MMLAIWMIMSHLCYVQRLSTIEFLLLTDYIYIYIYNVKMSPRNAVDEHLNIYQIYYKRNWQLLFYLKMICYVAMLIVYIIFLLMQRLLTSVCMSWSGQQYLHHVKQLEQERGSVDADIRQNVTTLFYQIFHNRIVNDLYLILNVKLMSDVNIPIGGFLCIGNSNTCPICNRLWDSHSQNLHDLDFDL